MEQITLDHIVQNRAALLAELRSRQAVVRDYVRGVAHTLGSFAGRLTYLDPDPEFRNLAFELMQFAEDCERAGGREPGKNGPAAREAMPEAERVAGFQALTASDKGGGYLMEDADGEYRAWGEMSVEGRLRQISGNAINYGLPFEPFAEAARETFGSGGATPLEDAALRLVWHTARELHELARLIPDDWGLGPQPPLVEYFGGVMAERAETESGKGGLRQLLETLPAPSEPTRDAERQQDRSRGR